MKKLQHTVKKVIILLFIVLGALVAKAQETKPEEASAVKWMTFAEAQERSKTEKRKIFIDVYTVWCGPCKAMDKFTFSDPLIAKILNENFYPVKFNAEGEGDILFSGRTFTCVPQGNNKCVHEFAMALTNNKLSYPTSVFLDEEFRMIQPLPGAMAAQEYHPIIQFIGENHFRKMKWTDFQATYKSPYPPKAPTTGSSGN